MVHFNNELRSEIELMNFGDNINEEIVGLKRERWVWERFGEIVKGESDFGVVFEES